MYITKVLIGTVIRMQENINDEGCSNDRTYVLPSAIKMIMIWAAPHSSLHFLTSFIKTLNSHHCYSRDTWFESRLEAESLDFRFRNFLISFQKFIVGVKRISFLPFSSTPHL
jgi:hypothetical protein